MNRFNDRNKFLKIVSKIKLSFVAFILLLVLFLYGISSVSDNTTQKQLEGLESALKKSIVQCYAMEGIYPPNLVYLENHYGLIYDKNLFFIDYQSIGSNMMPDITIITKQQ